MPENESHQITLEFHIDIANISKKDASKLCEYIKDYLVKNYNIINCDYEAFDRG